MTTEQARTIAVFRIHLHCTFSKIGLLADTIWDRSGALNAAGIESGGRQAIGQHLVSRMEEVLGIPEGHSDEMTMYEGICNGCNHTQIYVSYPHDTPKECANCHELKVLLPNFE